MRADARVVCAPLSRAGRNFGLPKAKSLMTTKCTVGTVLAETLAEASAPSPRAIDVELRVETTTAAQSSLAAALPDVFAGLNAFAFPSGDALDAVAPRSSRVTMRTTYLSQTLRISRPMPDLADAPPSGRGDGDGSRAVFVYARD